MGYLRGALASPWTAASPRIAARWAVRGALVALIAATGSLTSESPRRSAIAAMHRAGAPLAFSVVGWQVRAWLGPSAASASPAELRAGISSYEVLVQERDAQNERRSTLLGLQAPGADLAAADLRVSAALSALREHRPVATASFAAVVEAALGEAGFPGLGLTRGDAATWPLPIGVRPPVAFRLSDLPLNLVVARRDRIGIVGSMLVNGAISGAQIEATENSVDRSGYSSYITEIGGLGTYPSMVADHASPRRVVAVIAHEWAHHYLAARRLGRAYFESSAMRAINEVVADIVGEEIADLAYPPSSPISPPSTIPLPPVRTSDFGVEMRRIRQAIEELLANGQVAEAEASMTRERDALRALGFWVRKINTAYLSFFGSYSGGGNSYEAPLRRMRAESSSLAAFLDRVAAIDRPELLPDCPACQPRG